MPTVLITGASRGIGLEYVRQFAAEGWDVIATCRAPDSASDLSSIAGNITVHALDVDSDDSVAELKAAVGAQPIDVLINNAGINFRAPTLAGINYDEWAQTFQTNVFGPMRVADALMDNVLTSDRKQIAFVSSRMASIELNSGESYSYRSSKTALNMAVSCLALEFAGKGITAVMFHPGHVSTDMGGATAPVTPTESVTGMKSVILGLTPSDNGKFFNYDGAALPW